MSIWGISKMVSRTHARVHGGFLLLSLSLSFLLPFLPFCLYISSLSFPRVASYHTPSLPPSLTPVRSHSAHHDSRVAPTHQISFISYQIAG